MIESPDILVRLRQLVEKGGAFWGVFDRSMMPRTRTLELLDMVIETLPDELDQARRIMSQCEDVLDKARRQAGEIVDEAVRKAEKLMDADAVTLEARKQAKELMTDTDNYVATRLQDMEGELLRLLKEVRAGMRSVGGPKARREDRDLEFDLDGLS